MIFAILTLITIIVGSITIVKTSIAMQERDFPLWQCYVVMIGMALFFAFLPYAIFALLA